jgi:hypothetical protein
MQAVLTEAYPKPLTDDVVRAADVIVTLVSDVAKLLKQSIQTLPVSRMSQGEHGLGQARWLHPGLDAPQVRARTLHPRSR